MNSVYNFYKWTSRNLPKIMGVIVVLYKLGEVLMLAQQLRKELSDDERIGFQLEE